MANIVPVARVSAVQGQAFAKNEKGELRPLHVGDVIYEGDVLVTGANGHVELATQDNSHIDLPPNETLMVDAEVAGAIKPDATDAALLASGKQADTIIQAIRSGDNLDKLLDETATGDASGGADGGSTFVRLLRIAAGSASVP